MSTITHRRLLKRAAGHLEYWAKTVKESCTLPDGSFETHSARLEYEALINTAADLRKAASKIKRQK